MNLKHIIHLIGLLAIILLCLYVKGDVMANRALMKSNANLVLTVQENINEIRLLVEANNKTTKRDVADNRKLVVDLKDDILARRRAVDSTDAIAQAAYQERVKRYEVLLKIAEYQANIIKESLTSR